MIRFIATDMDGTLLTHDKKISVKNLEALRAAQEKGVILALASGRGEPSLRRYAEELEMYKYGGYLICNNGQKVIALADGSIIENPSLQQEVVQRLFRFAKRNRLELIMEGDGGTSVYTPIHMGVARYLYRRFKKIRNLILHRPKDSRLDLFTIPTNRLITRVGTEEDIAGIYFKIGMPHRKQRLDDIATAITAEFGSEISTFRVTDNWIDMVAFGVSKAIGFQQILDLNGIPLEASMAIGDSENDIDMLRLAGIGVAMGNAMPSVLAMADEVTLTNEEDGVAAVVLKHL
ncbi:MAG: Cof-type HAD-IIB family hydrolase [Erysipelotrichaceae bacterium]